MSPFKNWASGTLLAAICLALTVPLKANFRFYTLVQQTCKAYRVPVELSQMHLLDLDSDNPTFEIRLQSRRNNFEEVMLVGYVAAGQAMARSGIKVKSVSVMVTIPKQEGLVLMTTANVDLVMDLYHGNIKSSDFMRKLQWN